jgi:(S)-mandelate dehydrogenase
MMERAKGSGYKALVVTVDSLTGGRRERDARNNFAHEVRLSPSIIWDGLLHPRWLTSVWLRGGGMPRVSNVAEFCPPGATAHDLAEFTRSMRNPGLTWNDMAWMKKEWGGPFLIKGVLTAEDVRRAIEIGADGIVVSNHGGRQLDNCIATIDALPEIVEVAGDTAVVLIDGGVRRGSDVVKALALGAKGVLLGQATLYGQGSFHSARRGRPRICAARLPHCRRSDKRPRGQIVKRGSWNRSTNSTLESCRARSSTCRSGLRWRMACSPPRI